jgi:hypothetical protein
VLFSSSTSTMFEISRVLTLLHKRHGQTETCKSHAALLHRKSRLRGNIVQSFFRKSAAWEACN